MPLARYTRLHPEATVTPTQLATLTPKWSTKLAAFDAFVWDQCYAMEQSLRGD
jgi:hypothetical protein